MQVFMQSRHTRYSCRMLKKLQFCQQILEECLNIKFRENPSSGSRIVPCGRTVGQTDTMKQIAVFLNSANAPKNGIRGCALDLLVSGHVQYKWRALGNAVMKPRVPQKAGNFLTNNPLNPELNPICYLLAL